MRNDAEQLADRILHYLEHHLRRPTRAKLVAMIEREFESTAELRKANAILTAAAALERKQVARRELRSRDRDQRLDQAQERFLALQSALVALQGRIVHGDEHSRLLRIVEAALRG